MRYIFEFFATDGFMDGVVPPDAEAVRLVYQQMLNELLDHLGADVRVALYDSEEMGENPMQLALVDADELDEDGFVSDDVAFYDYEEYEIGEDVTFLSLITLLKGIADDDENGVDEVVEVEVRTDEALMQSLVQQAKDELDD